MRATAQTATHRPAPTDSTFAVKSFRVLSKDVTAFIDTVCDNNHVPCALVKVVAPTDFALTPIYRQALQKEFDIGLQLDHPYICHTVGMEQLEGLGQTIVM